jgi:tetratricopeptide (TPR) repeat protein
VLSSIFVSRWWGFVVSALALAACSGHLPWPRSPTMVRSFHGTLVPGHYVSPGAYQHYIQAQLLSNEGRAEEATEELRRALASDGASAYLRVRLAEELILLGRVDEARELVEAALHLDPQFPEAYVAMARIKLRVGDGSAAEGALRRALDLDRGCEEAYTVLAGLYRSRGQLAKMEDTWRELARRQPGLASAHEALGRAAIARGDFAAAESALKRALELNPGLDDARVALGRLFQADGKPHLAAAQLRIAYEHTRDGRLAEMLIELYRAGGAPDEARALCDRIEDESVSIDLRLQAGWLQLKCGQTERAAGLARKVLESGPHAQGRLLLADALLAAGERDAAQAELQRVAVTSPSFIDAQLRLGRVLLEGGRFREAEDLLVRAIERVGGPAGAEGVESLYDLLGRVLSRAGEGPRGLELLARAVGEAPKAKGLAMVQAAALERAGRWEQAIEAAQRVLLLDGDHVPALNFVGYVLADHGVRLSEARRHLERAVALRPWDGGIIDSLGWLYLKLGRLDDAERLLGRAERLSPGEAEILEHLGALYVRRADRAHALDAYRRALTAKPEERLRRSLEEQILLLETGRLGSR